LVDPNGSDGRPHVPSPSLWPVGFAVGIAILLLGLIVGWEIVLLGAILTVAFGFLWVRDVTAGMRAESHPPLPETGAPAVAAAVPAAPATARTPEDDETTYGRSTFLAASTLGIGAVIGGLVTLPVLGFMVVPAFVDQESEDIDLGPVDEFPEGEWRIATFLSNPEEGEVSRRTAYIRNNGEQDGAASFTIVSNRCVHLGCPVQPNGPVDDEQATESEGVRLIPTQPSGFGCPCHGGQYDTEGNRTAGPPVRALDRYKFKIADDRLVLTEPYSVSEVEGEGADAVIHAYPLAGPGEHVDGVSAWLYPIQAPS
jgi:menaquinol-cytochrome c reductase iron-sulfur subunit